MTTNDDTQPPPYSDKSTEVDADSMQLSWDNVYKELVKKTTKSLNEHGDELKIIIANKWCWQNGVVFELGRFEANSPPMHKIGNILYTNDKIKDESKYVYDTILNRIVGDCDSIDQQLQLFYSLFDSIDGLFLIQNGLVVDFDAAKCLVKAIILGDYVGFQQNNSQRSR
jgi:hypothetical protein